MRKLAPAVIMIAALASWSVGARAEGPVLIPVQQQNTVSADADGGVSAGKLVAIGAGLVVGGAIGASTMTFRGATVVGAVAGGLIGAWWYGDGDDTVSLDLKKP
jgi:hypothetical protein